jgi:hypothetical protein
LGEYTEEALLSKGAVRSDACDVSGGYANPGKFRSVRPDISAGTDPDRPRPFIRNPFQPNKEISKLLEGGTPLYVTSNCADVMKGSATGNVFDVGKSPTSSAARPSPE